MIGINHILLLELLFLSAITVSYLHRRRAVTGAPLVQMKNPIRLLLSWMKPVRMARAWTSMHLAGRKL